jgi:hypothetical protein
MLASSPASILNHKSLPEGIPFRFKQARKRSSVDRQDLIGEARLLEEQRDLGGIGRGMEIEANHATLSWIGNGCIGRRIEAADQNI